MISRRRFGIGAAMATVAGRRAAAEAPLFFRIGTAATGGSYYPIGGLIANAISVPPGSRPCDAGGPCGVPGLIAYAVETDGSVANVQAIQSGALESGFVQGDVAGFAYLGSGIWAGQPAATKLRAIANLYPDLMHLVTHDGAGIASVADLRGKRVAVGEPWSGTRVDAGLVLAAAGLSEADISAQNLPINAAVAAFQTGKVDAFFFVSGYPSPAIAELASHVPITLIPIDAALADRIIRDYPFFTRSELPADTYPGQNLAIPTLSVGAQWITSADQSEVLIYQITRALWNDSTQRQLAADSRRTEAIRPENALIGISIPLHPGAARFYQEAGLLR